MSPADESRIVSLSPPVDRLSLGMSSKCDYNSIYSQESRLMFPTSHRDVAPCDAILSRVSSSGSLSLEEPTWTSHICPTTTTCTTQDEIMHLVTVDHEVETTLVDTPRWPPLPSMSARLMKKVTLKLCMARPLSTMAKVKGMLKSKNGTS